VIVLDTHAWVWWVVGSPKLSARGARALAAEDEIGVCPVSYWEMAMLVEKGRLRLDRDVTKWVHDALARPAIRIVELTPEIAVAAARLPEFHGDPADRMIAATALALDCGVVMKDKKLRAYAPLRTVWWQIVTVRPRKTAA